MIWNSNLEWLANSHEPSFHEWYLVQEQTRLTPTLQSPNLAEDLAGCRDLASGWIWIYDDFSWFFKQGGPTCPTKIGVSNPHVLCMKWAIWSDGIIYNGFLFKQHGGMRVGPKTGHLVKRDTTRVAMCCQSIGTGGHFQSHQDQPLFCGVQCSSKIHFRPFYELRYHIAV